MRCLLLANKLKNELDDLLDKDDDEVENENENEDSVTKSQDIMQFSNLSFTTSQDSQLTGGLVELPTTMNSKSFYQNESQAESQPVVTGPRWKKRKLSIAHIFQDSIPQ